MFKGDENGSTQERGSLLSFSRGANDQAQARAAAVPLRHAEDAQNMHRAARARREARANPMLEALAAEDRRGEAGRWAAGPGAGTRPELARSGPEDDVAARGTVPSAPPARIDPEDRRQSGIVHRLKSLVSGWRDHPRQDAAEQPGWQPAPYDEAAASWREPVDRRHPGSERPTGPSSGEASSDEASSDEASSGGETWTPLIDPLKVIGRIFDSKLLIVSTTLLGALVGVAIALSTPKKYEAITELLVDPRDLKLSDRDLTEQGLPSDATLAIVENQVRVLTSGTVLTRVVDRLNLAADPEFNGEGVSFGVGAFIGELRSILSRGGEDDGADHTTRIAIENLARALSVERGGKTFVVTIGATTENPEKSALIANTMTEVFLETYGQIQSQTAGRAADELTSRLDELRRDVEEAERKVATFKAENDIIDPQGRLITDDEIIKLNDQLSTARAHTLELNARAASVRGVDVDSLVAGATPEGVNSSIITELRSQYAALKNEADRMSVRLGPRHPQRQAAEAQLAGAREQIAAELRRISASIQVELKRAVELEQQLAQRLAQLKVRQGDLSGELVQLRELERKASTARAVYEAYLLRARETGEQRDVNTANMSVISPAYPPLDPAGPSRSTIALTGAFLGFASGVGFAMMAGAWDSLRDRRNAQRRRARPLPPQPDGSGSAPDGGGRQKAGALEPSTTWRPASAREAAASGHASRSRAPGFSPESSMVSRAAYPYHPHAPESVASALPSGRPTYAPYPHDYGTEIPAHAPSWTAGYRPAAYPQPVSPTPTEEETSIAIAEIRASLAEFRQAVRELAADRQKRRFS